MGLHYWGHCEAGVICEVRVRSDVCLLDWEARAHSTETAFFRLE